MANTAFEKLVLVPHPDYPCDAVSRIDVNVAWSGLRTLALNYVVVGDVGNVVFPEVLYPERADKLWNTTCFEIFIWQSSGYVEYNFSPSTQWAAYRFAGQRAGMRNLDDAHAPVIDRQTGAQYYEMTVHLDLPSDINTHGLRIGLSAIVAEIKGAKSYWAVRHPDGDADFHHPDCFAVTLTDAENLSDAENL